MIWLFSFIVKQNACVPNHIIKLQSESANHIIKTNNTYIAVTGQELSHSKTARSVVEIIYISIGQAKTTISLKYLEGIIVKIDNTHVAT